MPHSFIPLVTRAFTALRDRFARLLIALADHAARHSGVPNPMAATRLLLRHMADQNLSGGDVYEELNWGLRTLGFTWPYGLCDECDGPLTDDEADESGLCAACSPDLVAAG